jgi:pimeloyl-ACP methyl ester carboxylesterase
VCSRRLWIGGFVYLLLSVLAVRAADPASTQALEFHISFDKAVTEASFTGRVYVFLTSKPSQGAPHSVNWFNPEPCFARDVNGWKPGETAVLPQGALGFPEPLSKLKRGAYWVQAVMDLDRGERSFSDAPGNGYSRPVRLMLDPQAGGPVPLKIDQVVPARPFRETERVKLVDVESRLLSAFYGRPVRMHAGVVLPKSFAANPHKHFPVVYEIPGFGGTHFMAHVAASRGATDVAGVEMLYVVLDPSCRLGHHVFADSENNGPRGKALVEELIPHIEKQFRGLGVPAGRFLTGHSSGGWSSLWLQVTYPDFFGGVWSTSPDPVDFRDFQRVNIYRPGTNIFTDETGQRRPLARMGGRPVLFYKPFSDMEVVMGHGGQLGSFEAVFSPRGPDGKPRQLWDRTTGKIDPATAKSWEKFDIRLTLERDWDRLAPKLKGKLHVYTGGEDTFYLEGAVALLKASLAGLGSDAVIEIVPGRDHGTLLDQAMRRRINGEMADTFRRHYRESE